MRLIIWVVTFGILGLSSLGCSSKLVLDTKVNRVEKDGKVAIWAYWVKDKGSKYDIQFAIQNISENPFLFYLRDFDCFRGATPGRLKHTFFNTGERTIDFAVGEVKRFTMFCKHGPVGGGDFRLRIGQIFANPSGDGRTAGDVITQDVNWIQNLQ